MCWRLQLLLVMLLTPWWLQHLLLVRRHSSRRWTMPGSCCRRCRYGQRQAQEPELQSVECMAKKLSYTDVCEVYKRAKTRAGYHRYLELLRLPKDLDA